MIPFQRFTEPAKRALSLAQEEAERSHHSYIGTEHLLLALLREEEGLGGRALRDLGADVDTVRPVIERILGRNERIVLQQIIPTSRVKTVLEISFEEAQRVRSSSVGTEHIVLGLVIEGEGIAAHVLEDLGATRQRVFQRVAELTGTKPSTGRRPHGQDPGRTTHVLRLLGATTPPISQAVIELIDAALRTARGEGAAEVTEGHLRRAMERGDASSEETPGT